MADPSLRSLSVATKEKRENKEQERAILDEFKTSEKFAEVN